MKTVKINYKVTGHKQAKKDMDEVTEAAKRLEAALLKLDKRGITVEFKVSTNRAK